MKERIQARINGLGELFVSTVARNRAMDAQAVRDTEALTFTAEEATSNGLADTIGALDDAIAVFTADMSNQEEDDMTITQEQLDAAVASAKAEGKAEGIATGKTEGAKEGAVAERQRIQAILDSEEGKKRPAAAMAAALDTDMPADKATAFLAKLPPECKVEGAVDPKSPKGTEGAAADFQSAMNSSDQPNLGAPGGGDNQELSKAEQALLDAGYKPKTKAA